MSNAVELYKRQLHNGNSEAIKNDRIAKEPPVRDDNIVLRIFLFKRVLVQQKKLSRIYEIAIRHGYMALFQICFPIISHTYALWWQVVQMQLDPYIAIPASRSDATEVTWATREHEMPFAISHG